MGTDLEGAPKALRKDSVGMLRVAGYTAAMVGPADSITLGLVVTISFAGFATPFVVLAAFIAAICAAVAIGQMAKRLPSAGSFFTYNSAALGKGAGFVSGHLLAFGYIVFVPAGAAASAYFFSHFLDDIAGWKINENIILDSGSRIFMKRRV